jgi:copper homeostasis protein (lipoprotein)
MKTRIANLLILLMAFTGCNSSKKINKLEQPADMHTNQISLDWAGTYRGVTPCADCPGIETALTLNTDNTYQLQTRYLERSEQTFVETGKFNWAQNGQSVTLQPQPNSTLKQFKVVENAVIQLSIDGQEIEGNLKQMYVLQKMGNGNSYTVLDKKWQLTHMNGVAIEASDSETAPWLVLHSNDGRINGLGGCNRFFGSYTLTNEKIEFSNLGATKMACLNMELETAFFNMLEASKKIVLSATGQLELSDANNQVLGVFKAMPQTEDETEK